jgi:predicted nucleic acid-binding protein
MNLLLDTCVLIDYLGRKEPFFADAQRIIAAGYFGDAALWAPAQSFKDAFYVLEHYVSSASVQQAMLKLLEVVKPVPLLPDDVERAARLQWDDYEDCLVALSAVNAKADYLITRDSKGFARSSVPAASPRAWIEMMEREHGMSFEAIELPAP